MLETRFLRSIYDADVPQHAGPRELRRLLDATLLVGSDGDLATVLQHIVEAATDLVAARYGALGVLDDQGHRLAQFLTVGVTPEERAAIGNLPSGHGLLGLLIEEPEPLRLPHLQEHAASSGFPDAHPPMTTFLGVPIRVRGEVFGNLYLCDKAGGDVFTDVDEEVVVVLAKAAGIAIDNTKLHTRVADLALFADHDRIARELHDTVIQRLFSIGLSLQGALRMTDDPVLSARLERSVQELDETVREVRTAIFDLQTARLPGRSLRQEILALCAESGRTLGFEPVVRFDGAIDTSIDDEVADHLLAVLREGLSNVKRHAGARRAEVDVTVVGELLVLVVADDGRGPRRAGPAGRGLHNMQVRASKLNGSCGLEARAGGGSVLRWTAVLSDR